MQKKVCYVFIWFIWSDSIYAEACWPSSTRNHYPEGKESPKVLYYNDKDNELKVDLKLKNVPNEANYFTIYVGKENSPDNSWSPSHSGSLNKPSSSFWRIGHLKWALSKTDSQKIFLVSLAANNACCNRMRDRTFLKIVYSEANQDTYKECITKECPITMDWNYECKDRPAVGIDKIVGEPHPPEVKPSKYKDSGNPFIVFNCTAFCRPQEVLVWYQHKDQGEPVVLLVSQSHSERLTEELVFTYATLNKTLEDSDRGSTFYCAKRVIISNEASEPILDLDSYLKIYESKIYSNKVILAFNRKITRDQPTVTVETLDNVSFEPNDTRTYECSSTPVDGRILVWYQRDSNSIPSRNTLAPNQKIIITGPTTMKSTLKLYLNESYDKKTIYCVQEYRFHYKNSAEAIYFRYGEIARSKEISLSWAGSRSRQLAIAGGCVAGALALLLVGVLVSRKRNRRRQPMEEEEDAYATPQVTYAVLSLPETASRVPKKPEKQNYVEIVGVYKDKTNNK